MPEALDGVLIVDKPEGLTSHDVVAAVRRLLPRGSKVGHTGTLDPFATGVLPLVIGRATRLSRFLSGHDKRYRAVVAFGTGTTTHDRTGEPTDTADPSRVAALTPAGVAAALATLVGEQQQVPPVYSAKKIDGVRAYARARQGDVTPPAAATVTAHALALDDLDGDTGQATLDVHCSAGYYVRALARDLGERLGVPAHLHALRRTAAGPFGDHETIALDVLVRDGIDAVHRHLGPTATLLTDLPAVVLDEAQRQRVVYGQAVEVADDGTLAGLVGEGDGTHVRLLDSTGDLVALAVRTPTVVQAHVRLQPAVVLIAG